MELVVNAKTAYVKQVLSFQIYTRAPKNCDENARFITRPIVGTVADNR